MRRSHSEKTTHMHAHNAARWMGPPPQHNAAKLNHWCQIEKEKKKKVGGGWTKCPPLHITHLHRRGSTNKDCFVCLPNVFWIGQNHGWMLRLVNLTSLCKSSIATIVLRPSIYGCRINNFGSLVLLLIFLCPLSPTPSLCAWYIQRFTSAASWQMHSDKHWLFTKMQPVIKTSFFVHIRLDRAGVRCC